MPINYVELETKKIFKTSKKRRWFKISGGILAFFLLFFVAISVYSYPKVNKLAGSVNKTADRVEILQESVEKQNILDVKENVSLLKKDLNQTKKDLSELGFVRFVPLVNSYYNDANHIVEAGILATEAGEVVADAIVPFGDILGLEGVESDLKGEEKVKVLVTEVLPKISEKTDKIESLITQIKEEVKEVNVKRYPTFLTIKGVNIRKNLESAKLALSKSDEYLPLLKNGAEALPSVLGYQKEKTYLLWFQNDGELRATGGFITAYGYLKVKDGELLDMESDDIYTLDQKFISREDPPEVFRKYLLLKIFPIRDSNISPDFKTSAEKFLSFYRTIPNQPQVDGVVAIDTNLVPEFLELTGPITLEKYGETFSAEPHPDYGISDAVYKLELYAQKILRRSNLSERKGPVGELMQEVLDRLFNADSEEFPKIYNTFMRSLEAKNIQFYFLDQQAQKLSEELGFAGRIEDFNGDYLHINNSNIAGLKGNFFTDFTIEQDIVVKDDGTVVKKVTNTIENTFRYDGWLNAVYQNWLRVYVPKGSKLVGRKVESDFEEKTDLGKTVWAGFSRTPPFTSTSSSFTYELPFKVNRDETYKMFIQKQGGYVPRMIIKINGKKHFEFDLKKDTELEFRI